MDTYSLKNSIIINLQEKGFDHDFTISGNKLLCVQQKNKMVEISDFYILEWFRLYKMHGTKGNMIILGLASDLQDVKGILIIEHENLNSKTSPALMSKIKDLFLETF